MMEFRQLEMFLGCGGDGEHLHVSHSAIHRQIRLLEHQQHGLLVRVGKYIDLTKTYRTIPTVSQSRGV